MSYCCVCVGPTVNVRATQFRVVVLYGSVHSLLVSRLETPATKTNPATRLGLVALSLTNLMDSLPQNFPQSLRKQLF